MKTYQQVHAGLFFERGSASQYRCECGAWARFWAYQHNAGEAEIRDADGNWPYSENIWDHYAPMCGTCHALLDRVGVKGRAAIEARRAADPEFAQKCLERARAHAEKGRQAKAEKMLDPEWAEAHREQLRANAVVARSAWAAKRAADPTATEALRAAGRKVMAMKRVCNECGKVSSPGGMGHHQKCSGHVGWTKLEDQLAALL